LFDGQPGRGLPNQPQKLLLFFFHTTLPKPATPTSTANHFDRIST
jgi:hypothetical protein